LATYCLNNLSNYITLYDISKTLMWIPTKWVKPIIHRNLVFQLISEISENKFDFEKLWNLEVNNSSSDPLNHPLNRQNSAGQSPLNFALEKKDCNSVTILLKMGVKIEIDSKKQHPLNIAIKNNDLLSMQCLLKHYQEGQISIDEIEKYCQIALEEDKEACTHLLTIEKHKAKKNAHDYSSVCV